MRIEERKLVKKFLIDPDPYEEEVRAALAEMKERKRRYGHPNRTRPNRALPFLG